MQYTSQNVQFCLTRNQVIPDEGPKAIPLVLDFSSSAGDPIEIDAQYLQSLGRFSMLQTIFVDMSDAANNLTIKVNGSGQKIVAKVGTQGYYSVLAPNPFKLVFETSPGGTDNLPLYLINVPIPGVVWSTV